MSTPPPLPPDQNRPRQPIPVLQLDNMQPAWKPYRLLAMVSWIIPLGLIAIEVFIPRPRGSEVDYTLTGVAHVGFVIGFLVALISLIGSIRRDGSVASAIVGIVLNAILIFSFPR